MTRLFQALPYQEQRRLPISLRLETTLLMAVSSTFRAVSTRAGTFIQMVGEQVTSFSFTLWALEILIVGVPQEQALLRTSARMAAIGQPALIPRPTVVSWTSIRVACARRIGTTVRTATPFVLPQNKLCKNISEFIISKNSDINLREKL